jgi:topoisomerase-4 subunit B
MSKKYTEASIKSLDWKEHIRTRPGMYIGKLGDGSTPDDGIYVLLKEVMDNSIDEHLMGAGHTIELAIRKGSVIIRDFGRGIPFGSVVDCVSKINTGGKYSDGAFTKTVGLNGVGTKAVNALSASFRVESFRDKEVKSADFERGELLVDEQVIPSSLRNGTRITFTPDETVFKGYQFRQEYVERLLWNYAYLNCGLTLVFNGAKIQSEHGLKDLIQANLSVDANYPIMHLRGYDIEVAITHTQGYGEDHYSFVNGQYTTQGGTHQGALRESVAKVIRDFYGKDYDAGDIRMGITAAIAVRVKDPVFESQTKTKLGSTEVEPGGQTMRAFVMEFLKLELANHLHRSAETADLLQRRILQSERERKDMAGIKKIARARAKKANLHNRKLRDCRVHYDSKHKRAADSTLFITEGDSASGSITKARDVNSQAVFSLEGQTAERL